MDQLSDVTGVHTAGAVLQEREVPLRTLCTFAAGANEPPPPPNKHTQSAAPRPTYLRSQSLPMVLRLT